MTKPKIFSYDGYRCGTPGCFGYGKTPKAAYSSWQSVRVARATRRKKREHEAQLRLKAESEIIRLRLKRAQEEHEMACREVVVKSREEAMRKAEIRMHSREQAVKNSEAMLRKEALDRREADLDRWAKNASDIERVTGYLLAYLRSEKDRFPPEMLHNIVGYTDMLVSATKGDLAK